MKKTNALEKIITPMLALVAAALASPAPAQIDPATGTGVVNGYRIGPKADLSGVRFSGVNLSRANLTGAELTQATFHRCNFTGSDLSGADLSGAVFRQCQFENANLGRAVTGRLYMLAQERWTYTLFEGCRFRSTDFSGADLWRADFSGISRKVRD
ncbi:MAG: pentapeptide repeat-containing protein, partial [Verrucomicrobiales bacterium]